MRVMYARCCGLDVHKKRITACVLLRDAAGTTQQEIRRFGTMTRDLLELTEKLVDTACRSLKWQWNPRGFIGSRSGTSWKDSLRCCWSMLGAWKTMRPHKPDPKDCQWIADLLQQGLLRGSFGPPTADRELRDLTRLRTSLRQDHTAVANRRQKILEDANLKLASVASDWLGVSGRAMLAQLLAGEEDVSHTR